MNYDSKPFNVFIVTDERNKFTKQLRRRNRWIIAATHIRTVRIHLIVFNMLFTSLLLDALWSVAGDFADR